MRWLLGVLLVCALGAGSYYVAACPCDRLPGLTLKGELLTEAVQDWSFANQVPLCQIQVRDGGLPSAVNLNCMSAQQRLFVSCANCDGKRWSTKALGNSDGLLGLDGKRYPVRITRVLQPETLDLAWRARITKLRGDPDLPRPEHWWSFELTLTKAAE